MTLLEQAHRLVERYAPSVDFRVRRAGGWRTSYVNSEHGALVLSWYPLHGLTVLLHELGHIRRGHHHHTALMRCAYSKAEMVMHEAEAWLWAERAARRHRIAFNYDKAEMAFASYGRQVRISWRYAAHRARPHKTDSVTCRPARKPGKLKSR